MKKHLLTAAMLALAISMTATSCHKDDDNNPADNGKTETTTTTPDDKKDDKTPVAEKVTITLPDGSSKEVEKDSKYTVSAQTTTDDGLIVKFFVNGEEVSGKEITISANTEITSKILATITFSDGTKAEVEKKAEYTLPAGEKEYIIYKIGDAELKNGDKISVDKNLEISIFAKYQELTLVELQTADFTGQDEVFLKITDVTDENVGSIKKYLKTKTNLMLAGDVTTIEKNAFLGCASLQSIVIPNSVETIGFEAFASCKSLHSVVIPNSVETIGRDAFNNCTSLQSIVIPNSVETIGRCAFNNCTSLQSVVIPNSVKTIGMEAFINCKSLQSIVIPNSVETIGDYAFYNCTSLQSVVITNSKENISISKDAFVGCPESLEIKYEPKSK